MWILGLHLLDNHRGLVGQALRGENMDGIVVLTIVHCQLGSSNIVAPLRDGRCRKFTAPGEGLAISSNLSQQAGQVPCKAPLEATPHHK